MGMGKNSRNAQLLFQKKCIFIHTDEYAMIVQFYKPHRLLWDFVSNLMIYDAELDCNLPPSMNGHPPIPEHSLYFYPRSPCISHNIHTQERKVNPFIILVGPMLERVNLTIGFNHVVIRVGFYPGGLHRLLR